MVDDSRTLGARYTINETIARGGMGTVYSATDIRLNRPVAVKLLKDSLAHDAKFVERFRREARAAASLSHHNIAGVYDYGEDDGLHYIVMEHAPGQDLARVLREEGPLDPQRVIHIGAQIAAALGHAHRIGLVHRDVKPANVLLDEDDGVKVTDFGIARAVGESTLTATGSLLGTAHYISPEQASGGEVGPPSDVYALGLVLYELVTGAVPFTGDSAVSVALRHLNEDVPAPSSIRPGAGTQLDTVVQQATAKDPAARYPDGAAMAAALGHTETGESSTQPLIVPTTESPTETLWLPPGGRYDPRKLGRAIIAGFLILLFLVVALGVWRAMQANDQLDAEADRRRAGGRSSARPSAASTPSPTPSPSPSPSPTSVLTIPQDIVGTNYLETQQILETLGFIVQVDEVANEAEAGDVLYTEPGVGSVVAEGGTITLFYSSGDEDDDHPGGRPPKGAGKGRDKDKDKDDD